MDYKLLREFSDPRNSAVKKQNQLLFKDLKLVETAQIKKRVCAMTWDLSGQKLVTGASDGNVRVRVTSNFIFKYQIFN